MKKDNDNDNQESQQKKDNNPLTIEEKIIQREHKTIPKPLGDIASSQGNIASKISFRSTIKHTKK